MKTLDLKILKKRKLFLLIFFGLNISIGHTQQKKIDSLLNVLNSHPLEDSVRVIRLRDISALYQTNNLRNAESYALQASTVANKINDDISKCKALSQLSSVYAWQRKTPEALTASFQQLEIASKIKSDSWIQDAYLGIGYVYELENEWGKALSYTLKALPYAEKTGNIYDAGYLYDYIGSEYLGVGNIQKAEEYLRKACAILKNNGDPSQLGDSEINFAKVFDAKGMLDSAKYHFNSAITIFTGLDQPYQIADTYQQMGDMFIERGLYAEAKECYEKTIFNYNKDDVSEADYALAILGLGAVAWAEKNYGEASKIFHEEFIKIKEAGIMEPQLKYLNYMAMADSVAGNYKEAFDHIQNYAQLYDKYYDQEKTKTTQRMLVEFDVQRKEKENEQLKLQYGLQQQRVTIFAVSGIILLVAGVFLALLYKQKTAALKSVKHLQQATETKNNELAIINAVKDKLISMIAHDVRSPLTSLQNILYLTREKILNEEEFDRLSLMLDNDIRHIISMLDNTLLWAREQIHALKINKAPFDLHDMANDVISLYHQAIKDKDIIVDNHVPLLSQVITDKEIIHTVMRNILSNAIKFTPPGKSIIFKTASAPGEMQVTIKDEGAGISNEILDKISRKEFISTRGTNNEKGTGLGLMFSFELLSKLGEKISIKTELGKGTAVTFSIAAHESNAS